MKKIERMKKHSRMLKSVCMKPFASMKLPTLTVRILSTLCALTAAIVWKSVSTFFDSKSTLMPERPLRTT